VQEEAVDDLHRDFCSLVGGAPVARLEADDVFHPNSSKRVRVLQR
jgi:hypothetical protein